MSERDVDEDGCMRGESDDAMTGEELGAPADAFREADLPPNSAVIQDSPSTLPPLPLLLFPSEEACGVIIPKNE